MKGPLGQGIANAVGLALALKHLAARFNKPDSESVDHYTYCIVGDGCNMEGILNEACSLAGHWDLGKLIVFYDDNHISIDGDTKIAFTEDVSDSLGWHALWVKNGNDGYDEIRKAIQEAKSVTDKPTMLKVTTTIGFGSPNKANSYAVHGAALGSSEVEAYRAATCSNRRRGPLPATVGVEGCYRPQPASRASTGGSRYRGLLLAATTGVEGLYRW